MRNQVLLLEIHSRMHCMGNKYLYRSPVGGTGGVLVKSGMYIDSHLERCLLVKISGLYTLGTGHNLS